MTETSNQLPAQASASSPDRARSSPARDATDTPIPVWPEGVLAVAAAVTLLVIGLRHRVWIERKIQEGQRAVEEFQKRGGLEDLRQVAQQAQEFLKRSD